MLFNTITSYDMQVQKQETKGHVQVKYIKQIKISIVNAKHNVNCKSSNTFTFSDSIFFSYRSCTIYQYQQNKILNKMLNTHSHMFLK